MYRDDNRDEARGCQCQTPLVTKVANKSVPESSACADLNKSEPDRLSDKELKIVHQYYQTVHAANEVGSLLSVATTNLQPSVVTFGFGGVTAEAVKNLKAPEQGSYFCFKATVSKKTSRMFFTDTNRTRNWFTYQFVDEGAQTISNINVDDVGNGISYLTNRKHLVLRSKISMRWETRRKRSSNGSTKMVNLKYRTVEDSHNNNDDDVGVGICYLTNINHLVLRKKMSMRWEIRRKRSSTCSSKMAMLKDGTVEDSQEKYKHFMKWLLKPVEEGPRDEADFENRKSVATRPADWEDWKKKKKEA
jgi:hypothetical protein